MNIKITKMKKIMILTSCALALCYVSCKNDEQNTDEASVEKAVEQMTEAVADTNTVVIPPADSGASK